MLNWLARKLKSDDGSTHGLATPRGRQRYLEQLAGEPRQRAFATVISIFRDAAQLGLEPDALACALDQLDAFVQPLRADLSRRLLDDSPRQVLSESIWTQLSQYYRAVHDGYRACVAALHAAGTPSAQTHIHGTVFGCRAMTALARLNMLARMRYTDPAAEQWVQMRDLSAWSRQRGQTTALVDAHFGSGEETTIEREYLVALLLEMAPVSKLLPAQIHGLDLLLRRHRPLYRIADAFDEVSTPFAVERPGETKPIRWLEGLPQKPGMRFFGLGTAYGELMAERERASQARTIPDWLGPSQLSLDRYRELLECLSVHWSTQPPARRQRREPRAGDILVTHDFASIRRVIGFGELARNGRTLEYDRFSAYAMNAQLRTRDADTLRSPTAAVTVPADEALRNLRTYEEAMESGALETWRLVDATGEGLGADAVEAAWAKAGMLVAYRRPDSADWALAVVRRLNRAASGTLRVGLRKLPGAASTARVSLNGGRLPLAADKTAEPAMHYDAITLTASHDCMLVPAGAFDPAWHCTLAVGRSRHAIRMARRIEYGLDFELLEYARASVQQAA